MTDVYETILYREIDDKLSAAEGFCKHNRTCSTLDFFDPVIPRDESERKRFLRRVLLLHFRPSIVPDKALRFYWAVPYPITSAIAIVTVSIFVMVISSSSCTLDKLKTTNFARHFIGYHFLSMFSVF